MIQNLNHRGPVRNMNSMRGIFAPAVKIVALLQRLQAQAKTEGEGEANSSSVFLHDVSPNDAPPNDHLILMSK